MFRRREGFLGPAATRTAERPGRTLAAIPTMSPRLQQEYKLVAKHVAREIYN
jgi:hypothetical protein